MTEREHERTLSELTARHGDELVQLRESMEAAHQAELEQAQVDCVCVLVDIFSQRISKRHQ